MLDKKLIPGITDLSLRRKIKGMWSEKSECGLTTLETRRLRGGGQIEVFKILNGHENIDPNIFFSKLRQVKELEDMTSC